MTYYKFISSLLFGLSLSFYSFGQEDTKWSAGRADGHAPIAVMGDHTHNKGELMFSYRFMLMQMQGMRSGIDPIDNAAVVNPEGENYMITPDNMGMGMHMLGAMYALSDHITLMGMVNYNALSMDHQTRMGGEFTTSSSGLGDIRIGGLFKVLDKNRQRLHFNLSLSVPTGSIDNMDVTPASAPNKALLPYPMQIGSGTFDLLPGITYLAQGEKTSMGAQVLGTFRLGQNERTYALGNQVNANIWGAYQIIQALSASLRINGTFLSGISGQDPSYMMMVNNRMVPTVFTENSGFNRISTALGANFYVPSGPLKNIRLGIEAELPVYQNINGIQLETDLLLTFGLQYAL